MAQHTLPPRGRPVPPSRPSGLRRFGWTLAVLTVLLAVGAGYLFLRTGEEPVPSTGGADGTAVAGALPLSDTHARLEGAPADPDPAGVTDGTVVHPVRSTPVHDVPDGVAFATVGPTQFGDAWFPVIAEQEGWVQVLLPSRPNGSAGWVRAVDTERATTPYRITVDLSERTLRLLRDGDEVREWQVGVGASGTPTPTGRTFLLGAFSDPAQGFSPVILPLGTHSPSFETYGGGPGTVAFHTWPDDSGYGRAVSDGCIRVPADALDLLTEVPLGTLVTIDQ